MKTCWLHFQWIGKLYSARKFAAQRGNIRDGKANQFSVLQIDIFEPKGSISQFPKSKHWSWPFARMEIECKKHQVSLMGGSQTVNPFKILTVSVVCVSVVAVAVKVSELL